MKEKKILIVDFDEESLVALSDLVNEEGFKAVAVADGLAGYEKLKSEDFDLVILEPMLPKLHGFELCKKIIQDPLRKIPIIVVTGIYREPACKAEALQVYGASAFFTKPWNKEELRAKILELLATSREAPTPEPRPRRDETVANLLSKPESPATRMTSQLESKSSSDLDEIERELREAIASLGSPVRKKEIKEKKAPKKDLDREVEAILKGAVNVLGLEETRKKPASSRVAPPSEPAPRIKPVSPPRPDLWKEERIVQETGEVKKDIPFREPSINNIPVSSSRVLDTESTPFGLQSTLLEVDRIPLDLEKPKPQVETESVKEERHAFEEAKKKYLFEEYAEPKKKKTILFAASGLAAVLVLATSLTFVFKSRKPSSEQKEMVASHTPPLPAEFALRQQEIGNIEEGKIGEPSVARKPELKKPAPSQLEERPAQAEEIIQPVIPMEVPPVQLHVEAEMPRESPPANEQTPLPSAPSKTEESSVPATPPVPSQDGTALVAKTQPGALVQLTDVTIPPVLLKRVDPKYPPAALTLGMEGSVTVNALISETGEVTRTEILRGVKGNYGFEKAAENAVRQWLFKPAQKDGVSVKVWKPIEIIFKLNKTQTKE